MNAKRARDASAADALPSELNRVFAYNLTAARNEKGMSKRELAGKSGMTDTYLARIERGNANVTLGMVEALASALQRDARALLAPIPYHKNVK